LATASLLRPHNHQIKAVVLQTLGDIATHKAESDETDGWFVHVILQFTFSFHQAKRGERLPARLHSLAQVTLN